LGSSAGPEIQKLSVAGAQGPLHRLIRLVFPYFFSYSRRAMFMIGPYSHQKITGLVVPASYHVYRSTPPPCATRTFFGTDVPRTPPLARKPAGTPTGEISDAEERPAKGTCVLPSGSGLGRPPTMICNLQRQLRQHARKVGSFPKPPSTLYNHHRLHNPYSSIYLQRQYPYQCYLSTVWYATHTEYAAPPPSARRSRPRSTAPPYLPYPY